MDENKKEMDLETSETENLETVDGVNYETNDNWKFDAQAPTVDDDILIENDEFEISLEKVEEKPAKPVDKPLAKPERNVQPALAEGEPKKKKSNSDLGKFIFVGIITAIVIAVLVFLGVRYYTVPNGKEGDKMNPGSVVATVDGTKISVGMYSYYYSSIVNYYENYASYGYYELDTSADYETQYTTDDDGNTISWAEFFKKESLEELENIAVLYNSAVKAGIELTDNQKKTINEQIDSLKTSASEQNVSLDEYIKATFGKYCSKETLELMLTQYYVTANYKGALSTQTQISDEEAQAYFNEHKDEFQQIEFSYIAIQYDTEDENAKADAVKKAEEYMPKMTDDKAVKAMVPDVYEDFINQYMEEAMSKDDKLSKEDAQKEAIENFSENTVASISGKESPLDEKTTQWLFSSDTAIGSTNYYVDEDYGYVYVILKTKDAVLLDDETYTVRHILIMPESDGDSEQTKATDEQMAAAKKEAEKILAEYEKGDKTEYSFALLAEQYSGDTASTSAGSSDMFGGLYEAVPLGQMVPDFEKWATDKSRKYGDTGIVESDYGYHIMFFINNCPQYLANAISELKAESAENIAEEANFTVHQKAVDKVVESYAASKSAAASEGSADTSADTEE